MEKKGLCQNCIEDKECIFPRKPPVLQCEEFSDYVPKTRRAKLAKAKKVACRQEEPPEGE